MPLKNVCEQAVWEIAAYTITFMFVMKTVTIYKAYCNKP